MEYQVPQFIEVEDKILGPLTLKQFIYLAGGIGLSVVCYLYLPHIAGIPLALASAGLGAALAFYKINDKPLIEIAEAAFNYTLGRKLYLWKREDEVTVANQAAVPQQMSVSTSAVPGQPGLSRGKLRELAWSLDIKDSNQPE
jgi:hypothetical protein